MARGLVVAVLVAVVAPAHAEPNRRVVVDTPVEQFTTGAKISPFLYLNRCIGGCSITGSTVNDARSHMSTIPGAGSYVIGEFENAFGQKQGQGGTCLDGNNTPCTDDSQCTGSTCDTADGEWTAFVKCMQEVYSPYAITVTDTIPAGGVSYTEAVVAGLPTDIGLGNDILGIAPLAGNCSPQDNVMSFSFANHHPTMDRVWNICWTAAQESAHAFGLDHEYEYTDGQSACNDPMTYRVDCGGEKFFRNQRAKCGEYAARDCRCTTTQNSHLKLLDVFGAGTPITTAPHVEITQITSDFAAIHGTAGSQRGVARVELWLNNSKWAQVGGGVFGPEGQPDPSNYTINIPGNAPNSIYDVVAKAFDDLNIEADSAVMTVEKGAPCTSAASCLQDQKCDNGRCYWDPPTSELGDNCNYNQACTTWLCINNACTQDCAVDEPTTCPSGFVCSNVNNRPICVVDGGGCCSVSRGGARWPHVLLATLVLAIVLRRRR